MMSEQSCSIHGLYFTISLVGVVLWSSYIPAAGTRPLRYMLPGFLDTPANITIKRGDEAVLPCAVENLGPKSVIWKKVTQAHPITIGEYVFVPDSRFYLRRPRTQLASPEWNLHIRDVQMKHAGVYECQISAKEDIVRYITLNVIETGETAKTGISLSGTRYVEKGTSIKLNCTAVAKDYLPEDVDWFKDGLKLRSNRRVAISKLPNRKTFTLHSMLEIRRSNMSDAGTYVCRSSNIHIASLKVIVLNAETSNVKRGTFPNGKDEDGTNKKTAGMGGVSSSQNFHNNVVLHLLTSFVCTLLASYQIT
ncbi:lachesin-like isoform X2 [Gigantopelta aegis]|uniref:lachesin-like isoform X2 n=1 Tax=Gigantopelta aegis TaxID=1735272 RepID=UPI001B88909F|nr:lachesin-like isoform X2 [Gigantopelta aegis]